MGRKVLITYKVMPADVDVNLEELKSKIIESISDKCEIKDTKEEPIAFGLKALKILVMIEEKEGLAEKIENSILNIDKVESVEVESLTLI